MDQRTRNGWIVTLSGTGINLALGVLYTWSVISKSFPDSWGWSEADRALPYTVACLVFAVMMVPAGRLQDKFGPRMVASLGGILTGLGLILASQFTGLFMFVLGFGVLAGTGIGFGYATATPAAVKWFPPAKTGMIAGIVVAGFGLASVYISPLAKALIGAYGVQTSILIFGVAFLVVVVGLSQLLKNPPVAVNKAGAAAAVADNNYAPGEMLKTPQFYMLWVMYAINAGAGLMVIGKLAKMVAVQADYQAGFVLVALLAIGNAGGRVLAGWASDKIGRIRTLQIFTVFQAVLMFAMPFTTNAALLVLISMCIGMNYGSNLALFPSLTSNYFGNKNLGVNYGLVFTAWGAGSILALVAGKVYDVFGGFQYAFYLAGALLLITIVTSVFFKKPAERTAKLAAATAEA